jgi:hypothetical protein
MEALLLIGYFLSLHFDPEDGDSTFPRKVGIFPPEYDASYF